MAKYPECGCFSSLLHGANWKESLETGFSKMELRKVETHTGCETCQVKRYTDEASRCQKCEIIRSYINCTHRRPPQLDLFSSFKDS